MKNKRRRENGKRKMDKERIQGFKGWRVRVKKSISAVVW
jgi:hypothetical protein